MGSSMKGSLSTPMVVDNHRDHKRAPSFFLFLRNGRRTNIYRKRALDMTNPISWLEFKNLATSLGETDTERKGRRARER